MTVQNIVNGSLNFLKKRGEIIPQIKGRLSALKVQLELKSKKMPVNIFFILHNTINLTVLKTSEELLISKHFMSFQL